MTELDKVAIGRIVIRAKERFVAIRPLDGLLCVETMRYADEVVARDGLRTRGRIEVSEREVTMAHQLVESLVVDQFEPEKFHDEYREQVLDLIERKAAGEDIVAEPESEAPAKVLDLVAALEASLEKAAGARRPASEPGRSRSRRRRDLERQGQAGDEGHQGNQSNEDGSQGAGQEDRGPHQALGLRGLAVGRRAPTGRRRRAVTSGLDAVVIVGEVAARGADRLVVLERDPVGLADLE